MVARGGYIPDRGDLVWVDFDPQSGREQAKRRPAIVLSRAAYNGRAGLFIVCPITSRIKGYPFEVVIPAGGAIAGAVLADQVRSLDWLSRSVAFIEKAPTKLVEQVTVFASGIVAGK